MGESHAWHNILNTCTVSAGLHAFVGISVALSSRVCSRLERKLQQVAPRQLQRRRDGAQARVRAAHDVDHQALLPRVLHDAQLVRQQRHARVPRRGLRRQRACTA